MLLWCAVNDPSTSKSVKNLAVLQETVVSCRLCPRLVAYREEVARTKRAAYRNWNYWGRPVPSLGEVDARLLVVGLAPAAHGGNRTGRIFTGDRSADFLFSSLHRAGFASQPTSHSKDDGLRLIDCYITAPVHCAPPDNKPLPVEFETCRRYLRRELQLLAGLRAVVALGRIAWDQYLRARREVGQPIPKPLPKFGHLSESALDDGILLVGSYHPSQQNTQTGKLTPDMLDRVFARVRDFLATH